MRRTPSEYITGTHVAMPPEVAYWVAREGWTQKILEAGHVPDEVCLVLEAVCELGRRYLKTRGVASTPTESVAQPQPDAGLLSVAEAADRLGYTDEGVRKAIREGRLVARKDKHGYVIEQTDFLFFERTRHG